MRFVSHILLLYRRAHAKHALLTLLKTGAVRNRSRDNGTVLIGTCTSYTRRAREENKKQDVVSSRFSVRRPAVVVLHHIPIRRAGVLIQASIGSYPSWTLYHRVVNLNPTRRKVCPDLLLFHNYLVITWKCVYNYYLIII